MSIRQSPMIEVRVTRSKGRGVYATEFISEGTTIEIAPVLVVPASEIQDNGDGTHGLLSNYVFEWGRKTVAIALGYGSLYNHSYGPNARYEDHGRQRKAYIAVRDIQPGEEITINYNGDETSQEPVWFDVVETPAKPASPTGTSIIEKSSSRKKRSTSAQTQDSTKTNVRSASPTNTTKSRRRREKTRKTATRPIDSKTKARRTTT